MTSHENAVLAKLVRDARDVIIADEGQGCYDYYYYQ